MRKELRIVFLTSNQVDCEIYAYRAADKFGGEPIALEVNVDAVPERRKQYIMTEFRELRQIIWLPIRSKDEDSFK